ncbi:MAG: TIGR01212 family radical SAM protein [Solirubrobacterales bacterium]
MKARIWGDKRFHSLNHHLRQTFGGKVVKIPLNAGFTCPNRDGTKGYGGCTFCSAAGSGEYAGTSAFNLKQQFDQVRGLLAAKWPKASYIAYFQPFTNTYAPADRLEFIYRETLAFPDVVGISIASRPDCLADDVLDLLTRLNQETYLWLELGLQTIHEATGQALNRGYTTAEFQDAVKRLRSRGIRTCAHVILGLPGESREMMLQTARALAETDIQGIKLHALHVLEGSALAADYQAGKIRFMDRSEYVDLLIEILEILPPDMVIQRLTGDGPRQTLLGPDWSLDKGWILNELDRRLRQRNTWQGRRYQGNRSDQDSAGFEEPV